jgi:hypothetical protein
MDILVTIIILLTVTIGGGLTIKRWNNDDE